jgi:hypothetical protein
VPSKLLDRLTLAETDTSTQLEASPAPTSLRPLEGPPERPRHPPVSFTSCATLFVGQDEAGVFRVVELSVDDVLLEGRCPLPVGQQLMAVLHFSPFELRVLATLLRHGEEDGAGRFTLKFVAMSTEDRICVHALAEAGLPGRRSNP